MLNLHLIFFSHRYMLGLAGLPSLVMLIGFIFMPESPRWLIGKNRTDEATVILRKIRGTEDVSSEVQEVISSVVESQQSESSGRF